MEQKRKSANWMPWILMSLLLLTIGYPLSKGPVVWLYSQGVSEQSLEPFRIAYQPLDFLLRISPRFVCDSFEWYVGLWYQP